jgi:hypothetical protein
MENDDEVRDWKEAIEGIPPPTDLNAKETLESREELRFYLNQQDYELVSSHITRGIACFGLFLILASNALLKISEDATDVFLGLGVELIMGAALVTIIYKDLSPKWESALVVWGLSAGVLLSIVPLWCGSKWWVQLLGAIGIELFGGVIIYAFIESIRSKLSKRNPDEL